MFAFAPLLLDIFPLSLPPAFWPLGLQSNLSLRGCICCNVAHDFGCAVHSAPLIRPASSSAQNSAHSQIFTLQICSTPGLWFEFSSHFPLLLQHALLSGPCPQSLPCVSSLRFQRSQPAFPAFPACVSSLRLLQVFEHEAAGILGPSHSQGTLQSFTSALPCLCCC